MKLSGHLTGLLKEYMRDLVEQAKQETSAQEQFGFSKEPYRPDQALSDLLALLDDRIESEGMQVGLPNNFLHDMWSFCNESGPRLAERVWLELNVGPEPVSKARTRELTYRNLIQLMEAGSREHS
jgi:hypothetical protein